MGIIKGVLEEEYQRLKLLEQKYFNELSAYPVGAISKRERSGNFYLYLNIRKGKRVITKYIGKYESLKSQQVIKEINKHQIIENKLKEIKKDINELERILNGKKI